MANRVCKFRDDDVVFLDQIKHLQAVAVGKHLYKAAHFLDGIITAIEPDPVVEKECEYGCGNKFRATKSGKRFYSPACIGVKWRISEEELRRKVKSGMTQKQIAEEAGVSPSTVANRLWRGWPEKKPREYPDWKRQYRESIKKDR